MIWFMSAPVAGDIDRNLARARRWLRWLWEAHPGVVVVCPWLHDIEALPMRDDHPEEREASIKRCEAVARICDAVVLVGGRVTEGMRREAAVAKEVIDLTWLGAEPPTPERDDWQGRLRPLLRAMALPDKEEDLDELEVVPPDATDDPGDRGDER